MESETTAEVVQTKEILPTNEAQVETKDDALAAGTEEGHHEDRNDGDRAAAANDTKEPVATEGGEVAASDGEGGSSQAEGDTVANEESDSQKAESEPETEKVPLDMESTEEKNEETPTKVRFDVSRESTEAAEESKVDPTAIATDTEQGSSTATKQPLPSTESERKFQVACLIYRLTPIFFFNVTCM